MSSESPVSSSTTNTRNKQPSLQACIACRKSHLKCDGQKPVCSRCSLRNSDCIWIESRRGYRDNRKSSDPGLSKSKNDPVSTMVFDASMADPLPDIEETMLRNAQPPNKTNPYQELFDTSLLKSWEQQAMPPMGSVRGFNTVPASRKNSQQVPSLVRAVTPPSDNLPDDDLLDTFYKHFYPGHPYVVPRKLFQQQPSLLPEHVRATMRFVASHYVNHAKHIVFRDTAAAAIFSDDVPQDGFLVQALVTYIFGCSARSEPIQAMPAVEKALSLATQIGMNRHAFSIQHGRNDPVLEECWRRTWWSLYLLDGLITATAGMPRPFRLHALPCDTHLPCDDEDYKELRPSRKASKTLGDMEDRTFLDENVEWSSFAYSIEAMAILGRIFSLGEDSFAITDPQVEALDASISTLIHSLPADKRDVVVGADGKTDECLLTAHMLINMALIFLHRPRSILTFVKNHYRTVCSNRDTVPLGVPALAYSQHTSKAIKAADSMMNLVSLQRPMSYATPCLMCGVTMAATVHLPAYAMADTPDQAAAIKERLKLGITALGAFGETWPKAVEARGQVARFAREMFTKPELTQAIPTKTEVGKSSHTATKRVASYQNSSDVANLGCFNPGAQQYDNIPSTNPQNATTIGLGTAPIADANNPMALTNGSLNRQTSSAPQHFHDSSIYRSQSSRSSPAVHSSVQSSLPSESDGADINSQKMHGHAGTTDGGSSATPQSSMSRYHSGVSPMSSASATTLSSPGIYVSPTGILCNQTPEEMAMAMSMMMGMNGVPGMQPMPGSMGIAQMPTNGMDLAYLNSQPQLDGAMSGVGMTIPQASAAYKGSWR